MKKLLFEIKDCSKSHSFPSSKQTLSSFKHQYQVNLNMGYEENSMIEPVEKKMWTQKTNESFKSIESIPRLSRRSVRILVSKRRSI